MVMVTRHVSSKRSPAQNMLASNMPSFIVVRDVLYIVLQNSVSISGTFNFCSAASLILLSENERFIYCINNIHELAQSDLANTCLDSLGTIAHTFSVHGALSLPLIRPNWSDPLELFPLTDRPIKNCMLIDLPICYACLCQSLYLLRQCISLP